MYKQRHYKSINFELSEIFVIHILNCIDLVLKNLYNSNFREYYYSKEYYFQDLEDLKLLRKLLIIESNSGFYNIQNADMFEGQKKLFWSKDKNIYDVVKKNKYNIVKKSKNINSKKFIYSIIINTKKHFKNFFYYKNKKVG